MGYRADKEQVEKKLNVIKRVSLGILLLCLVGLCIFSAFVPPTTWKYYVGGPTISKRKAGELRIHFLDVWQGDCSLIELPDGKVMLIDGGGAGSSTERTVLRYLNALKIDVIDHLVITHSDEDHCGALDLVFKYKKVLNAYLPPSYVPESGEYADAYAAVMAEKCNVRYSTYSLGELGDSSGKYPYSLSFVYPYQYDVDFALQYGVEDDNLLSSVVRLDYNGVGALFAADISFDEENIIMANDGLGLFQELGGSLAGTEILKVAHHGSANSTSLEWLQYLGVKTAVISCGENNPYGHPTQETLARLFAMEVDVWRTDRDGHVAVTISADGTYKVKKIK